MRKILLILLLLPSYCFGQRYLVFSSVGQNNTDTALSYNTLWLPKYANADTNKVLGIDARGMVVIRTKGTGGSADSSVFTTQYQVDTAKTTLRSQISRRIPYTDTLNRLIVTKKYADSLVSASGGGRVDSLASEDDSTLLVYQQAGVLFQTLVHKGWSLENIQRVIDSTFWGFQKVRIMCGVLAPDSIPTVLNNPITWSFLFSNSQHEYNFCPDRQDSITASGSSILIHYDHCRLKNVMYGVACMDDAISGYGMTLGTGVADRWLAIAATAKYEVGGYIYFDAPHTLLMGNGFKGNLSFSYDTTTAILTVGNLNANYELTQEMWNLSLDYAGDNNYKWKRLRNSLPGSELTNLKYQLQDGATGSPITGGRATTDVSFFRGNDVPQLVNLNIWDQYSQQLIFYNSNIWVMIVGEGY